MPSRHPKSTIEKVFDEKIKLFVTKFVILICQSFPDKRNNSCIFKEKGGWLLLKLI